MKLFSKITQKNDKNSVKSHRIFQKSARTPDAPFSLFEGWAGALCFVGDLLRPERAQFPMVPVQFF
jgi:hypothetical protein